MHNKSSADKELVAFIFWEVLLLEILVGSSLQLMNALRYCIGAGCDQTSTSWENMTPHSQGKVETQRSLANLFSRS